MKIFEKYLKHIPSMNTKVFKIQILPKSEYNILHTTQFSYKHFHEWIFGSTCNVNGPIMLHDAKWM